MAIYVACRCGQAFEADAYLAGKVVQCPTCNSPLVVPTLEPSVGIRPVAPRPRTQAADAQARSAVLTIAGVIATVMAVLIVVTVISVVVVSAIKGQMPWSDVGAPPPILSAPPTPLSAPAEAGLQPKSQPAGESSAVAFVTEAPKRGSLSMPTGWNAYEHPTAGYSVILPAFPERREKIVEDTGETKTFHVMTAAQNEHVYSAAREYRSYVIAPENLHDLYDEVVTARAAEVNGVTARSEDIELADGLVRDAIIQGEFKGKVVRVYFRVIGRGNSILELSCQVPPGQERADDIKAFLGLYRMDW